jgi:uncharacterized lipoprotein YmbA
MRNRLSATLGLAGLALVLAGCVSLKRTDEARFFVLQSLVEPQPAAQDPVALVGVETARLPGHLERPQLVTWVAPGELKIDEFLRWAEPLEDGVTRTLAENLAALLPDHQVVRRPWAGDVETRCRVRVALREFGLQRDGTVLLTGQFRLLPGRGDLALVMRPVRLEHGVSAGAPPDPGVDAMNELLEQLSRQVADAIRALPPERDAADAEDDVADLEEETVESEKIENR